jgi:two-component sensor histidine kinase
MAAGLLFRQGVPPHANYLFKHALLQDAAYGTLLRELRRALLHPRINYSGPVVQLSPKAEQGLALAFHELVTNACKYGALTTTSGRVAVHWTVFAQGRGRQLRIVWRETGGPAIEEAPVGKGFGSRLITLTALDLGGTLEMQFGRDGLEVTFELPN